MEQRTPHSIEAERAILGAVLLDNAAYYQTDRLTVEDFYTHSHRVIYRAMCELMDDGKPVDFVTITEHLEGFKADNGKPASLLENIGGVSYVTSLTDGLPRVRNIQQYVNIVLDKSKRRKLIQVTSALLSESYEMDCKVDELISSADKKLLEIGTNSKTGPLHIKDILPRVNQEASEQWTASDKDDGEVKKIVGKRTGIDKLDALTTGYRKREVTVISGWTSDGKSVLMKQGLLAQMQDRVPALVFSREISKEQLIEDLKCHVAEVPPSHSRDKRKMDLFEREAYNSVDQIIKDWPLFVDDDRGLHIDELVHRGRKMVRMEGVEIIYVDYIQLIHGTGGNPTEKMESVCAGIWQLADSENIPVVALAQLSRDRDKIKRKPRLQDLKGASRIEQDAHVVIFVYRPEDENGSHTKNDELIIPKQRHGATGTLFVEFNQEKLIFEPRVGKYT